MQGDVQGLRRGKIPAEGLLEYGPRVTRAVRASEPLDYGAEQARRNREIVERSRGTGELLVQGPEGVLIRIVAVDVHQPGSERREGSLVHPASVLLDAVAGARPELVERPAGAGHRDDGHIQVTPASHRVQGREDLLVGEVARRPEEDERIGTRGAHAPAAFST